MTADGEVLTVGGVNYDEAPTPIGKPADQLALNRGPDRDGATASWPYLRGTERELRLVGDLAGPRSRIVRGAEAGAPPGCSASCPGPAWPISAPMASSTRRNSGPSNGGPRTQSGAGGSRWRAHPAWPGRVPGP